MKAATTFLLLLCWYSSLFASTITDSLLNELDKTFTDSARLDLISDLVRINLWNNPDEAYRYAEIYDSIAQRTQVLKKIGMAKNFKGMCHHVKGDTDLAITKYFEAIRYFEKAKDTLFIGILYNNIGGSYQYREKIDETIQYFEKALVYFEQIGHEEWINNVQVNLAVQNNYSKNYDKAIAYNTKAYEYFKKKDNQHMQGFVLANLGGNYFGMEQFEKCIEISETALELINPNLDSSLIAATKTNIGISYLELNQPAKAKTFLDESLAISRALQSLEREKKVLEALSFYYEKVGDFENALLKYKAFEAAKDKFFNKEKDEAVVKATTIYETEKKQQEIDLLNAKNEVQKLRLEKSQRQAIIYTIGIVGLGLLTLLLFYAFQVKKRSLAEKELLLKEIHHRVKNNLQIVTSLLNIQQRRIKDEQAINAIQESKNRVESMALIHQSLYQNNDLRNINARDYIQQLVETVFKTYRVNQQKINYHLDIQQLQLDMDTLIPLGLIINEMVSNALKHAFRNREAGTIKIALSKEGEKVILNVSDNGNGLPETDVLNNSNSFGFRMIKAFVKKLDASLDIIRQEGTMMKIAFEQ